MGSSYRPEVSLKQDTEYEDLILRVEGRADGIFTEEETVCIDEIKGVYKKLEHLESPVEVHRAQAMCYAWIYMLQNDLEKIDVQMTYAHLDTEEIRRFRESFSREELEAWYQKLTGEYHKWVSFRLKWQEKRNASMKKSGIPLSLPQRPERNGCRRLSCCFQQKTDFCTGAYRSGKNHVLCISFCAGNWRGKRGAALLSYGKNYYQNRCSGCL